MKGLYTILLLLGSNVFMTLAWYGHLKLQQTKISDTWPLMVVIVFSWGIAFFEYSLQIPANRIGFLGNGGVLPDAVEGDTGGHLHCCVYGDGNCVFPR